MFFIMFMLMLFIHRGTQVLAEIPKLKPAVEIKELRVIGEPIAGGAFQLEVRYKTHVAGNGIMFLKAPERIELPERGPVQGLLQSPVEFRKGRTQTKQFTLRVGKIGTSMIEVEIAIPEAPPGYKKAASRYLKIISEKDSYRIIDPRKKSDLKPKEIGKDVQIRQGSAKLNKSNPAQTLASQTYNVSVSGRIKFIRGITEFGVYGNGVALWFRNSSNPDEWYHPVVGHTQHVHYDVLDEQGNFTFNFSFDGDLSGYNQAIVIVNTANDATYMPAPPDGYIVWHDNGYTYYFNESEGVIAAIDGSNPNITVSQDGELNREDGSILRYMMLASEFVIQRYDESLPFNLAVILTIKEEMSDAAGKFVIEWLGPFNGWTQYIKIDPSYTEFTTTSHEYGHWVNYRMWNNRSKFNGATSQLKEGWAIFYSFGARNYGNKSYGDDLRNSDDNTETAPFETNPRYRNIRYASAGEPDKAAAACYQWNLYDDYSGGNFEANTYNSGDNEDIVGYQQRAFEKMRTLGSTNISSYHSSFKSGLASDVQNSINDIYDFMLDDLDDIPSEPMRAAQVTDFNKQVISSTRADFTWTPQSYSGNVNYGNYETGYRLYWKNGSSWQLITTLTRGATSYTYNSSSVDKDYKITSYNSAGEAVNAPIIWGPAPPSAPTNLVITNQGAVGQNPHLTWNASSGATSYNVYRRVSFQQEWWLFGSTTSTSYTDYTLEIMDPNDPDADEFFYQVTAVNSVGESDPSNSVSVWGLGYYKAISNELTIRPPQKYELQQNYPNPFNPVTEIKYELPDYSQVTLSIFNLAGQKVRTLVDETQSSGYYGILWDGKDKFGNEVASGVYLYRIYIIPNRFESKPFEAVRKMTLLQ